MRASTTHATDELQSLRPNRRLFSGEVDADLASVGLYFVTDQALEIAEGVVHGFFGPLLIRLGTRLRCRLRGFGPAELAGGERLGEPR